MKKFPWLFLFAAACSVTAENTRSVYYVFNEGAEMPVVLKGPDTKMVLLFVHGGPGGTGLAASYSSAFQTLSREYRTVFYDQRGSGAARGHISEDSITVPQNVRDLDAVVSSIKARRPDADIVIVGHSFGGLVAGAYASVHSARIKALVLVSPALNVKQLQRDISPNMIAKIDAILARTDISQCRRQTFIDMRSWYEAHPVIDMNGFIAHNTMSDPYYELEGLKGSLESLMTLIQDPLIEVLAFPDSALSVIRALARNHEDSRDLTTDPVYNLANITVPSRLFTGWKDVVIPADSSAGAYAFVGGVRSLSQYTSGPVGHSCFIEAPDLFVQDLKNFLETL